MEIMMKGPAYGHLWPLGVWWVFGLGDQKSVWRTAQTVTVYGIDLQAILSVICEQ